MEESRKNTVFTRNNLVLIAIVAMHIVFKLFSGELLLAGDEVYSVFHAQKSFTDLYSEIRMDMNPPVYYVLLHVWIKIFGIEPMFLKALPILFSLGSAVLIFRISINLSGLLMAITNSALYLFSNIHYDFSHEIRAYSLITFLCLLSFHFLLKFIHNPIKHRKSIVFFCLTHLLLIYSHYNTVFIAFFQTIFLLYYYRRDIRKLKPLLFGYIGIVLLYIPQLFVLFNIMPDEDYWLDKPNLSDLKYIAHELFGNPSWVMLLSVLCILFLIFSLAPLRNRIYQSKFNTNYIVYFMMWYLIPLLTAFGIAQFTPMLRLRYVLYCSFGVFFLLSYCISMLQLNSTIRSIFAICLISLFFLGFKPENRYIENWKIVSEIVEEEKDENTCVLINAHYMHVHFLYYWDREGFKDYKNVIEYLNDRHVYPIYGSEHYKLLEIDEVYDELLLILSHNELKDPNNLLYKELINKGWYVCERFGTTKEAKIYRFVKNQDKCWQNEFSLESTKEIFEGCYGWTIEKYVADNAHKITYRLNQKIQDSCLENNEQVNYLRIDGKHPFSPRPTIKTGYIQKVRVKTNIEVPESYDMKFILSVEEINPMWFGDAHLPIIRYEYELNDLLKSRIVKNDGSMDIFFTGVVRKQLDPQYELRAYLWNYGGGSIQINEIEISTYLVE